jgi:Mrp family chromosome partitioning ATPase
MPTIDAPPRAPAAASSADDDRAALRASGEFPRVLPEGGAWLGARARNAVRRPMLFGAVSLTTILFTLLLLVLVPKQASRALRDVTTRPDSKPDTMRLSASLASATVALQEAQSALTRKKSEPAAAALAPTVSLDTFPPSVLATRDSLALVVASLGRLIARAQASPLPSSYRAIGQSPSVRGDPRMTALLDSLSEVEKDREAFGAVGGVDPIYVSLTAQATSIGHDIQRIAEQRRAALRREMNALVPTGATPGAPVAAPLPVAAAARAPVTRADSGVAAMTSIDSAIATIGDTVARAAMPAVDTTAETARRTEAQRRVQIISTQLAEQRQRSRDVDRRLREARERANVSVPPLAMLGAALALGLVLGFGAAFAAEVRDPRVADAREAERVTRTRVLAVVRPNSSPLAERSRRRSDITNPALADGTEVLFRTLYLSLSATGATSSFVTITGDEPLVLTTVAVNLAAIAAQDFRSVLLIDADPGEGSVASLLRAPRIGPGLSAVLAERATVSDTLVPITIGRDRTIDVIPAGPALERIPSAATADRVRFELARLARRYDLTIVATTAERAERGGESILIAPDVIVCARVGQTSLAGLASEIERLRRSGTRVRGVVVWDAELPRVAVEV